MESTSTYAASLPKQVYLVVQRGSALLDVIELPEHGRITIGRAHSNRVVIADAKCSRQHCEIYWRNSQWFLRDLNSRNGVVVDGLKVDRDYPLALGSVVTIGQYSMTLSDEASPAPRPASDGVSGMGTGNPPFEIIDRKSGTQYDGPASQPRAEAPTDQATALFRIARGMANCQSEKELCQVVLDGLLAQLSASLGGVLLLPEQEHPVPDLQDLIPCAEIGPGAVPFSTFLTQVAFDDCDAILARDIPNHASLSSQPSLVGLKAESAICSPIRHDEHVLGVIHLYTVSGDTRLTQEDLEFVLAVADQLGDQLFALRERKQLEVGLDRAQRRLSDLHDQLRVETELVGSSPRMEELRRAIARIAPSDALVLIRGESGVGKELVARGVHFNSKRKDGPFVCVNCAALSESLLESELFGHEKGAFTGAASRRAGKFEQAHGGTLFLDEIGEMSPEVQAKFLRVLEGQPFERVGGGSAVSVDVRVVTATNRDLEEAVREKRLRRDLFFRLQVIEITVPPLRMHPEDIPEIAKHFLSRFAAQSHRRLHGFTQAAIQKLQAHDWPGNVRELRNVVERAVILSENEYLSSSDIILTKLNLNLDDQPVLAHSVSNMEAPAKPSGAELQTELFGNLIQQNTPLDEIDRLYIEAVLRSTYWNKSKAARILQIERTTLDRRLKKYGLARPAYDHLDPDFERDEAEDAGESDPSTQFAE